MHQFPTMRCLHDRGPRSRGLVVDGKGVMLGSDCTLIRRTAAGYRVADPTEFSAILRFAFGHCDEFAGLDVRLGRIARALDAGELAKAQILGLQLPFGTLDEDQLWRLDVGAALVKDGFDPNQPRDGQGRWTDGSGTSGTGGTVGHARQVPIAAPIATGAAGVADRSLWRAMVSLAPDVLESMLRTLGGPATLAAGVLISTNDSNIHEGKVPGLPGIGFRSDEGVLTFFRQNADGTLQPFYTGFPDSNGLYHDGQGNVIGRKVGTTLMFDTSALPALESGSAPDLPDRSAQNAEDRDRLTGKAPANDDDQPRVCPPVSPEDTTSRSERSLAYQEQITGLPRGYEVVLNGVGFDGCDEETGNMLEAKGPGFAWPFYSMQEKWLMTSWKGYRQTMDQARRQSAAAGNRLIEWHFSDEVAADFFRDEFAKAGYANIRVTHTPAKVLKHDLSWAPIFMRPANT